jgi:voltage-gated potassium channel
MVKEVSATVAHSPVMDEELVDLAQVTMRSRRDEWSATEQRRIVIRTVLRVVGTLLVIIVGYALIPFDGSETWTVIVTALVGLAVIVVVAVLQLHAITVAHMPSIKAVETLGLLVPLVVFWFAATYYALSASSSGSFDEQLNHVGAVYFSMTTLTTIGYGDISAQTDVARVLVMMQMVVNVLVVGLAVRFAIVAVRRNLEATPDERARYEARTRTRRLRLRRGGGPDADVS